MLRIDRIAYESWRTTYFQRSTVIVTELVLAYALQKYVLAHRGETPYTKFFWKIHLNFPKSLATCNSRCRFINLPLSSAADHRPCTFSIQWLFVRHPHFVSRSCPGTVDNVAERYVVYCAALSQAYLLVFGSCILRLLPSHILPRPEVDPTRSAKKHLETCIGGHRCVSSGPGALYTLQTTGSSFAQAFSLLPRPLSRLLGSKHLGHVFFC